MDGPMQFKPSVVQGPTVVIVPSKIFANIKQVTVYEAQRTALGSVSVLAIIINL